MRVYRTEQREILLRFLRAHKAEPCTIEEITAQLADTLATSTVYRLMNKLVEEGAVRRFTRDNARRFVYQLVEDVSCHTHLHLKCSDCGRLIHVDTRTSEAVCEMLASSEFEVDEGKTLLWGHCKACRKAEGKSTCKNDG